MANLILLGPGGKLSPTLALRRSRSSSQVARHELVSAGIEIIACDLLDRSGVDALPDIENVIYMTG